MAVEVLLARLIDVIGVVVFLIQCQRGVDARVGVGGCAVVGLAELVGESV